MPFPTTFRVAALLLSVAIAPFAEPAVFAGGGLHAPRVDNAWERSDKGYRGIAGLQIAGDNFAIVMQGGHAGYAARGARASDSSLLRGEVRLFEAHFLPKFYLRRGSVSAYLIGGGGPQWRMQETWTEMRGSAPIHDFNTRLDVGFQWGFGVEAEVTDFWKIGLAPSFHTVYWNGRQELEYAAFNVYLML